MSTTSVGQAAELAAAEHLITNGFRIIARNWKTCWCEIDIIAVKEQVIYFIEVKYRKSIDWGNGLEYITPRKLRSMQLAANIWLASKRHDYECALAAIDVSGIDYVVDEMVVI